MGNTRCFSTKTKNKRKAIHYHLFFKYYIVTMTTKKNRK